MVSSVRGTHDLYGDSFKNHDYVIQLSKKLASFYGYNCIQTPIFEFLEVFSKSLGDTTDVVGKEMYTFEDRGGDKLTLRPEGTAAVVRALIQHGWGQTLPQKLLYFGPMFRYERPQKGRYRQFHQVGAECLGSNHFSTDVECIALAQHILDDLECKTTLEINTLGNTEDRAAYKQALVDYFMQYEKELSTESKKRLTTNPLRILDSKNEADQKIVSTAPTFGDYLSDDSKVFFDDVLNGLSCLGINFIKNPHLVRGLDYYCHTTFEFKAENLGAQSTVLGGGRYDGLVKQMGGPDIPAIGWAFGIERMCAVAQNIQQDVVSKIGLLVFPGYENSASKIAQHLRKNGKTVELFIGKNIQKLMTKSLKRGIEKIICLGENELQSSHVVIKNLLLPEDHPNKSISCDIDKISTVI